MGIIVPKYSDLYNSIIADFKNKLNIFNISAKSVLAAIASTIAAKQKLSYITIARVNNNIYPDTSDAETLRRAGRIRLGRDINPAVSGQYNIEVTGESGAVVHAGTTFTNSNGFLFIVDIAKTLTSTTDIVQVRALTPGQDSALSVSQELQLTAPLPNIDTFSYVAEVVIEPTSAETIEEYRQNVIDSYRVLPQGGSRSDYRTWTESVSGVREVYPYAKSFSVGEINLYVEAFPDDSTDGNGTPSAAILTAVQNAIEPDKIPLGVYEIHYLAVDPEPIDVEIENISDVTKLTSIESLIEAFLYTKRPYIAGADLITDINKGRIYASEIFQIVISSGVSFDNIVCKRNSTIFTSTEFTDDKIPYVNSVTNKVV